MWVTEAERPGGRERLAIVLAEIAVGEKDEAVASDAITQAGGAPGPARVEPRSARSRSRSD